MNRDMAHRSESRIRLLVETLAFFGLVVFVVLFLSLDGVR